MDNADPLTFAARALLARLPRTKPPHFIVQSMNAGCIVVTTEDSFDGEEHKQAMMKRAVKELIEADLIEKVGPIS